VLESQNQAHGYCPIVQPYEYYGDSGYPQVAYSPYGAGSGWTPASNSNSAFFLSPKYPAYELTVGDPARWKTEGN